MSKVRILSAARAVLEKEGAASLTVRKVAGRAGLSPMAMYRHFQNKDALLNALMDDGLAAWEDIARGIRVADPLKWLAALGEAFLEFALREPHRFDAAFFLPAPRARQYPQDFASGRSPVVAMAIERIEQARAAGLLRDRPPLEMALSFSGLAQGLVSMYRANRFSGEAHFRMLYRTQMKHCLDSFLTDREARK
ncbi:MAG TPA: TetR/AcrR family transcriptional regulator [Steroidobacteraceae bacterium]|nr:TetR/AcrR family transcriptional regulator [Steroidobacteraceae bacterium]